MGRGSDLGSFTTIESFLHNLFSNSLVRNDLYLFTSLLEKVDVKVLSLNRYFYPPDCMKISQGFGTSHL